MAIPLKQSTASQEVVLGPFVDSGDGATFENSLTIANTDIKLWVQGATATANKNSGGATYITSSNGLYYCVLDATDTATLGALVIFVSVSGALPVRVECVVLTATNYDAAIAGTAAAAANVTQWNGSAVATPAVTGVPKVDITHFGGSAGTFSSGRPEVNTTLIEGTDATNQIRDAVVDDATRIDASALNTLSSHDPGEAIMGATDLGTGAGLTSLASAATLGTPAGASVSADIAAVKAQTAAIEADTQDLQTQVGTDGAGLTALPWNAAWDAEVQSEVADALAAYDPPTNAEMEARTLAAASYATASGVSAVETDTQDIQSRLPASLSDGRMRADTEAINAVEIDGAGTSDSPFVPAA